MTSFALDPDIIRIRSSLICARSFCTSPNCPFLGLGQGEFQVVYVTGKNVTESCGENLPGVFFTN